MAGKVVSITDYGAFIELEEGIEGLIHVSEMSWTKRVKHPSKVLNVGDAIEAVVLEIDQEARRLSLGLKQTEPNPWSVIEQTYRIGDRIKGTVRNLTDFGAFVEVEEGVDGLVHISDLSWTKRIKHPSELLTKGEEVEAVILKIDSENQRLSLGLKQLQPNAVEDFFRTHTVGDALAGKIVRLTEFGAFIEILEGVEGLVHVSEMSEEHLDKPEDRFNVGDEVKVKIIKMDPVEKKIGLTIKGVDADTEITPLESYRPEPVRAGATFADLQSAAVLLPTSEETTEPEASEPAEEPPAEEPPAEEPPAEEPPAEEASAAPAEPEAETDAVEPEAEAADGDAQRVDGRR